MAILTTVFIFFDLTIVGMVPRLRCYHCFSFPGSVFTRAPVLGEYYLQRYLFVWVTHKKERCDSFIVCAERHLKRNWRNRKRRMHSFIVKPETEVFFYIYFFICSRSQQLSLWETSYVSYAIASTKLCNFSVRLRSMQLSQHLVRN